MKTKLQVLSEEEKARIHEATLKILSTTGVRVDTAKGRSILRKAGAEVDENSRVVRLPRTLVEDALRSAPKKFTLGARREGWDLTMNDGNCVLCLDGEGISVLDHEGEGLRPSLLKDWMEVTRLSDMIDEVGMYWCTVRAHDLKDTAADYIGFLVQTIKNFSKHIQEPCATEAESEMLKEVLQIVFGDVNRIRATHPWSFLLCPQSPLIIDETHTDAYLAVVDWDVRSGQLRDPGNGVPDSGCCTGNTGPVCPRPYPDGPPKR
jgi:trimethylamine--corrinoid protein Co-methyltransferase